MQNHVGLCTSALSPSALSSVPVYSNLKLKKQNKLNLKKITSAKKDQTPEQTKIKKVQFQLIFFHNQFFTLLNRPVLISSSLCFTERCAPFKQNQDTKKNTKNNDKQRQTHTFLFNFQTLYWKYFNKITSLAGLLYQYGGKTNKQRQKNPLMLASAEVGCGV